MHMILPLRAILFQFLLLLVSIAVEAVVLHRKLRLSHRTSIEYAASINLWSSVLGWLFFFIVQANLSKAARLQLISYIFFNNFYQTFQALPTTVIVVAVFSFFLVCYLEYKGLDLLQAILQSSQESQIKKDDQQTLPLLTSRLKKALQRTDTSKALVILLANAWSHVLILLFLFLRLSW